jgi:cell division protein FtsQ
MWLVIAGGMITLLAAAMRNQKSERCSGYTISIKGATKNLFVDEKDVVKLLTVGAGGKIKGQMRSSFDLHKLEQKIEKNVWIKDAELYFDNNEMLHVTITEREPVARVFTTGTRNFYIDAEGTIMPLSDKMSASVPVFTGFPDKKQLTRKDSVLLNDIRSIAVFVNNDRFWSAQVSQIDITVDREFEMIPLVGNHIVKLGKGDQVEKKFHRLFVFYKEVVSQAGFDKYKTIDVQYSGQVIGVKGNSSKVDSLELRKSVEKLLEQSRQVQNDTIVPVAPVLASPGAEAATEPNMTLSVNNSPNPLNATLPAAGNERPAVSAGERQPRAVMQRRNE